jgi:hypothetical protein
MSRIVRELLSLCFIISFSCVLVAQVPSNCTIPSQLINEYNKDIVQLATNYLVQTGNSDTVYIRIPQAYFDSVASGLAAIFNAASIPERDSVYNLYCVHDHNGFPYDYAGYLVQVDTNYQWTHAWRALNTVTGDAYIDDITSTYSLHVVNYYNWSWGQYAELATDSSWNVFALSDTFELSPGVITAEPNYLIGMAGRIEYKVIGSDRYYNFYFEFNDCFDGCDNYHEWSFMVDSDCAVTYLGFTDWGVFGNQPLPPPLNCNEFTNMKEQLTGTDFQIFPNPSAGTMELHLPSFENSSLRIYDVAGIEIYSAKINSSNTLIDLSNTPDGIYIAEVNIGEKTSFRKIIKVR